MKTTNAVTQSLLTLILLFGHNLAFAALPATLNYQGHLTDSAGAPINGVENVTFKIYDVSAGGTALWTGTLAVTVDRGVFSIELGANPGPPLPLGMFETPLWIGIAVGLDAEMAPRRPMTTSSYAFKAGDANTLEGISASSLDQSAHVTNTANPHVVTAAQVGAASAADITTEIATHAGDTSAHHSKTSSFVELSGQAADAQIPAGIARDLEVMDTVLSTDGSGSMLDADLLDGQNSSAFMSATTDNWVNISGDTMTGALNVNANINTTTGYQIAGATILRVQSSNVFLGGGAGQANTTGGGNTFSGYRAGYANTTGSGNTFFGFRAGDANTEGMFNTFSGDQAGRANITGSSNTFSGYFAGIANTTGGFNTFSGTTAGYFNTIGKSNTFLGNQAGRANTTGNENTSIGRSAGYSNTIGTGNVFLGYSAGYSETGSNKLYIDNSATATPLIYGDFSTNELILNADVTVTGNLTTTSPLYGKVAIVAQSGGDYVSPLTAMTNLATWCGIPAAANPCLVRIMPGIYDLGNNALTMQPWVDVEGSGENTTTITSIHSSGNQNENSATVVGADNAEIRFLTIENRGGSTYALAVYNNSASPKVTHVTAMASGGTNNRGVYNSSSSPVMTNVMVTASGGANNFGVYNNSSSSPTLTNVMVTAAGGTFNYAVINSFSSPTLTNVMATASGGTSYGLVNNASSSPILKEVSSNGIVINGHILFVPASGTGSVNGTLLLSVDNEINGMGLPSATKRYVIKLDAGIYDLGNNALTMRPWVDIEGGGETTTTITSTRSSGNWNEDSATVVGADNAEIRLLAVENRGGSSVAIGVYNNSASPKIMHVTVTVSGGTSNNIGVNNSGSSGSSPTMMNVTVTASGGTNNRGVYNSSSSPVMTNVTVTASGGADINQGVLNSGSSPVMTNVTATASGGFNSEGVANFNAASPTLTNVTATGSGATNRNDGVSSANSSSLTIINSSLSGTTHSIFNSSRSTARVGSTMLDGPVNGSGFTCVGVYDASFTALGSGCL